MYESYQNKIEHCTNNALTELDQNCCKILTNYEPPERDYWFRIVLTCATHKYRTFWIQMIEDKKLLTEKIKSVIEAAESEDILTDRPFPYSSSKVSE